MLSFQNITIFLTILFSGLVAGLFYAYSCSVNPGLNALNDVEYLKAMQSINGAIQNPYFFCSFMGLPLVFPLCYWQTYGSGTSFYLIMEAAIIYFIFVFCITIFGNVPLNNMLESFKINEANNEQIASTRRAFEKPWNQFHLIRTLASVISFCLCILSIVARKS
ncbi:MAG: DUF1772 domain-containing protein [Chitinophagaceae bacterium]|jgi:uncharacterized membrane protein